jgi:outer membrane protein assembly factor BamA
MKIKFVPVKLKLLVFSFCLFAAYGNAQTQQLQLKITSNTSSENQSIKTIGYLNSFRDYKALTQELEAFKNKAYKLGYIEARILEITQNMPQVSAKLSLGPKYEAIQIYASNSLFKLVELEPLKDLDDRSYFLAELSTVEALLDKLTKLVVSKSYPFASLSLTDIKPMGSNLLSADLVVVTKQSRQLNAVEIKGYDQFPRAFIRHFLGIKTNKPFDLKAVQSKTEALDQLSFARQLRPAEVLFTQDSTSVYLYLEKNKSNRFDGFLGFGSEETTGNLEFNGYLNLNLVNNLNFGESFNLNYRSDENDLKTFDSQLTLPYLFKTPIGSELQLSIIKKDSTFTTSEQSVSLYYQLNPKQKIFLGIKTAQSNALDLGAASTAEDYKTNAYELRYTYQNLRPNNLLFPVKRQLELRLSKASRSTTASKTDQNIYLLKASNLFQLNTSNSLFISLDAQGIDSKNFLSNELLRFGGIKTIRGFEENSINASAFGVIASEYRFQLGPTLYIHSIVDAAYFNTPAKSNQKLVGLGFGFGLITQAGLLKFNLANGQVENQNFRFSDSKVHLSLTARF